MCSDFGVFGCSPLRWRIKCTSLTLDDKPDSLQAALQCCDDDAFPNINLLLVMSFTVPITTRETERVNGKLRLLKTYL